MKEEMKLPRASRLVSAIALLFALVGCIAGIDFVMAVVSAQSGYAAAYATLIGFSMILGSLLGLGLIQCFLALLRAQIDTRNAIVQSARHGVEQGEMTP